MKLYLATIITILMLSGCTSDRPFWKIIKVNLKQNQHINVVQNIGDSIIFIGGSITKEDNFKLNDSKAFLCISIDGGNTWIENTDFGCNSIDKLSYNANILLITGMKVKNYLTPLFYRYLIPKNKMQKLEFPTNIEVHRVIKIIDQNTYLFYITKSQLGNFYLKTVDCGKTWSDFQILMDDKRAMFDEMYIQGNKMWGIKTHYPNWEDSLHFQSLVSVNMNTRKVVDNIPLGTSIQDKKGYLYISDIKAKGRELFLLGQIKGNNMGYIWKVSAPMKAIEVQDSFKLTKNQITDNLFLYKNKLIVTYTDVSTFLPKEILLYKSINDKSWRKQLFPEWTYPTISFNKGVLMGIAEDDKIYYKQF